MMNIVETIRGGTRGAAGARAEYEHGDPRGTTHTRAPRGGADGAPGRTLINGEEQPAKTTRELRAGDVVRLETPGGGGFGRAG